MSIDGVGNSKAVQQVTQTPIRRTIPTDAPHQLPATDRLELSGMSHLLKTLKTNDVRTDKVAEIKARIENGSYEDDTKLSIAVDRLLDELNR